MKLNESMLSELDHEGIKTRKSLERVPEDKFTWKPHAKSFAMGALAQHLATISHWGTMTLETSEFDLDTPGAMDPPPALQSGAQLLEMFDGHLAKFRAALAASSDAQLQQPWSLKKGSHVIFTMPRLAVLREMIFNHTIHHRAQLGVYLRLNDVPVPALYGPSSDEQ
jgi:uncharacterized damage-inducible protein DinB